VQSEWAGSSGLGNRERIGAGPVVGHLTSATQLEPGGIYRLEGGVALHADAEVGIQFGRDVPSDADTDSITAAIAGYRPALELVDLSTPPDDPESIVAANGFHRAFTLGSMAPQRPPGATEGQLIVNGDSRATAPVAHDFAELMQSVAVLLGTLGEQLQAGDCVITGAIVQLPIQRGDTVIAALGPLGRAHQPSLNSRWHC
jgi:2-keto-4-pentenoate hydratase